MSEFPPRAQSVRLDTPQGIPLQLWRMPNRGKPPVLLIHGASAQHETFCIPRGRSLSDYLWRSGYEPWLLDWRGSCRVVDALDRASALQKMRGVLDFDGAAEQDLPLAIERVAAVREEEDGTRPRLHAIAHCMGATVLAQAIASGSVAASQLNRIVLIAVGLFYSVTPSGKIKSRLRVLDRLWHEGQTLVIDPRSPKDERKWPEELRQVYETLSRCKAEPSCEDLQMRSSRALRDRLSFMYGEPFREQNLVPEIQGVRRITFSEGELSAAHGERVRALDPATPDHATGVGFVGEVKRVAGAWKAGDARGTMELIGAVGDFAPHRELWADDRQIAVCSDGTEPDIDSPAELGIQFGAIPLRMYLQGTFNVRRGWAAPFGDDLSNRAWIGADARERFHALPGITLITGARNQLWQRGSLDTMQEWLLRGSAGSNCDIRKAVLSEYGHQDLLWGARASDDVFPMIVDAGLGGESLS